MNANELADELEKGGGHYMLNIASMLRQQANRIAKLEEELKEEKEHSAILEKDRDAFLTENEALQRGNEATALLNYNKGHEDGRNLVIPHPVKELTDEEIIEIANGCLVGATAWNNPELDPIEFAKAILRKAQEK